MRFFAASVKVSDKRRPLLLAARSDDARRTMSSWDASWRIFEQTARQGLEHANAFLSFISFGASKRFAQIFKLSVYVLLSVYIYVCVSIHLSYIYI